MEGPWTPHDAAGGVVRVWLPPGAEFEHHGSVALWSPDAGDGRFTVAAAETAAGGDALLAAERDSGGEVDIESDERLERGGLSVRRLRYRSRRQAPREIVGTTAGRRTDVGGDLVETLADFLLFRAENRLIRVGYAVNLTAPQAVQTALVEVLERCELGDEAR